MGRRVCTVVFAVQDPGLLIRLQACDFVMWESHCRTHSTVLLYSALSPFPLSTFLSSLPHSSCPKSSLHRSSSLFPPSLQGVSECYECQPKPAAKTFPGCTIRNTPSEPIHCIVWAKHLFSQLYGEPDADNDVSPETEEGEEEGEQERMDGMRKSLLWQNFIQWSISGVLWS